MNYQINISIDSPGVTQIHQNAQFITIVKNVTSNPLATGNLQVAWLTFQPFQNNQISWVETYYLYATQTQLQAGATILMTSQTSAPVQLGPLYDFSGSIFSVDPSPGAPNTYNVENLNGQSLTFGLAQFANINGASVMAPLNATPIGNDQQATFTPIETVSIYLSSFSNNGVVISQVAGSALTIELTSQQPVANVGFTDSSNSFFLINQTAASGAVSLLDVALGRMPQTPSSRQLR